MKLAFITDEATQDFQEAVALAGRCGLQGLELRSVNDTPIDQIDHKTLREWKALLDREGLQVCNLAASFYKCDFPGAGTGSVMEEELEKLVRLCDAADILGCDTIRGFAFFAPKRGEISGKAVSERAVSAARASEEAISAARASAEVISSESASVEAVSAARASEETVSSESASAAAISPERASAETIPAEELAGCFDRPGKLLRKRGKRLLLEADPSVNTTNHSALAKLLAHLDRQVFGAIYDPGNDIYDPLGETPFPQGYQAVRPYLVHIHIKDAVLRDGKPYCVKPGTGLVDYPGLFGALRQDGYQGWLSLEPHYRKDIVLTEEQMRLPQGRDFSRGGREALEESAEAVKELLRKGGTFCENPD